jgi:hypothetical protein
MRQNHFILLFLLFISYNSHSQEEVEDIKVNNQFWSDYNLEYPLEEFKSISGFIGYRTISPKIFDNLLLVTAYNVENKKSLKFLKLKKPFINSYHFGGRINYVANKNIKDNFEFRLMQGIKFYLPSINAIPLMSYVRFEERFQKTFDGSDWAVGFRFRYRLSTVIKWKNHLFDFNKGLYIPLNVEFFVNLKKADRFNDVIRISPGIGYKLNDDWKFELYVSYHNTLNTAKKSNTSNDFVLRLRIFKLKFKTMTSPKTEDEKLKDLIE